jgi:mannitol-1-/sugar-/sorbitol-6-/2-deoxyglucose-6-phosphatase
MRGEDQQLTTHTPITPSPHHPITLPSAVIFDMDGLLIDSEPLWRIAEVEALAAVGVPISEEDALETTGLRTDEVVELWHARFPWADPPKKAVEARIISRLIDLVRKRGEAMPGVHQTLQAFSASGYPLAIASSSTSEIIAAVLETLGIGGYFRVAQSAEHEPFGKPHPGVYIEAARALGVEPRLCLAFEDSPNGVIAAKAARMTCIAVPDPALAGDRRFGAADLVLGSLADFRMAMLVGP